MPDINFKLLHIFIAIADNKSFRQASEKLNRSQSAVSMQIKQLGKTRSERRCFTGRRAGSNSPPRGEAADIRPARIGRMGEWPSGNPGSRRHPAGTLTFACIPTIAATILPRALRGLPGGLIPE